MTGRLDDQPTDIIEIGGVLSSEYIAHLISARARQLPEPSPLVLMRQQDVLDLDLPPADLSAYSALDDPNKEEFNENNNEQNQSDP